MAGALALMKKMEINTPVKGIVGVLGDTGVGFGASYAIGQVYHRYGDKWAGKNVARITAIGGKLGALLCSALAGGHQTFVGNFANSVGQAGVNAIGLDLGLRHARKATGKKAVLVPAGADLKSLPGATDITAIGALGNTPSGRGLSWSQIEELASGR